MPGSDRADVGSKKLARASFSWRAPPLVCAPMLSCGDRTNHVGRVRMAQTTCRASPDPLAPDHRWISPSHDLGLAINARFLASFRLPSSQVFGSVGTVVSPPLPICTSGDADPDLPPDPHTKPSGRPQRVRDPFPWNRVGNGHGARFAVEATNERVRDNAFEERTTDMHADGCLLGLFWTAVRGTRRKNAKTDPEA